MENNEAKAYLESKGYDVESENGVLYVNLERTIGICFAKEFEKIIKELHAIGYTSSFGARYRKDKNEDDKGKVSQGH